MRFFVLLLFLFAGCTNPPYRGADVCGADDFVMDSYQIRCGKYGILEMEGKCFDCLDETLLSEYKDVIHEGDLLHVAVHHPTRSDLVASIASIGNQTGFRVMDGKVRMPDLDPIDVEGLTLLQAQEKIQEAYQSQIRDLEIFLSYRDKTERKVELIGMVQQPLIPVDGKMRLFEVLAMAKVPPTANLFKSYLVRDGALVSVDLFRLVKEGDMSQNVVMRGGDKVYIADPSASTLMVLGEVGKQRVIDLPNGFMTLRQALAEAGGIPYTGDKRFIQVIRGNMLHPKIYTLNWQHIIRLPSDSMLLIPGDIVYVAATPIAEWDRFVNQVLPTLVGLDLILRGVKNVGITLP